MARGIEGNEISTQRKKTSTPSTSKPGPQQRGIAAFFQKKSGPAPSSVTPVKRLSDGDDTNIASKAPRSSADLTPLPSSAGPASSSPQTRPAASQQSSVEDGRDKENGVYISENA